MRTVKPQRRAEITGLLDRPDREVAGVEEADDAEEFDEGALRVACPDCAQPIALSAAGQPLPVHALCPTPWDPFGLTVCAGSGRVVTGEAGTPRPEPAAGGEAAILAALPEGLDWRLQPFSHATGPGTGTHAAPAPTPALAAPPTAVAATGVRARQARQSRVPRMRQAA